ncbi:MauE/DoxX family redox-associated membrane protein [Dawidia soli]|uniref:Methylamine utilisation protein MauE domain-containing protein n=1 Tax=Dawidia soli TaxID=2782352 RepID=A0AAP2GEE7_9BACT|nr:MauE/DoxX family redox-associated membrane protein [Dawidia soli]MBT1688294.1 hypothetical protein [Dawidia soli]
MKAINLLDIIVFSFVILFIYAATNKLATYDLFVAQLGKSPLIMNYAPSIAWMIPTLELILAIALLIRKLLLAALFGCFTLMLTFTLYIGFIINFSPYVPCSCGGILNSLGWTEHMLFNIIFIVLAVLGIGLHAKQAALVAAEKFSIDQQNESASI